MNNKKVVKNYDVVVEELINFCGEEHRKEIKSRANKVKFVIVDEKDSKYEYVKEEPICIKKKDYNCCVVSKENMCSENANIIVTHSLVRAILEDSFIIDGKDHFDSTIVNYIAQNICYKLEEKDINLGFNDYPNYRPATIYSKFFGTIEKFFNQNKQSIINAKLTNDFKIGKSMKEAIEKMQEMFEQSISVSSSLNKTSFTR